MKNLLRICLTIFLFNCTREKSEVQDVREKRTWEVDNKICSGPILNNFQDSLWICKYANGRKANEGMYNKGKKNGLHVEWYESGKIKSEVEYQEDILSGVCRSYFENGQIKYETTMHNNVPNGEFSFWYPNGILSIRGTCKNKKFRYLEIKDSTGTSTVKKGNGKFNLYDKESQIRIVGEIKDGIVKQPYFHFNNENVVDTIYSESIF